MGNWDPERERNLPKVTMAMCQRARLAPRFPDSNPVFFLLFKCRETGIFTQTALLLKDPSAYLEEWSVALICAWEHCPMIYTTANR